MFSREVGPSRDSFATFSGFRDAFKRHLKKSYFDMNPIGRIAQEVLVIMRESRLLQPLKKSCVRNVAVVVTTSTILTFMT